MNYSFYLTNGIREYSDGATANEAGVAAGNKSVASENGKPE